MIFVSFPLPSFLSLLPFLHPSFFSFSLSLSLSLSLSFFPLIPELGRQMDLCEFEVSLVYRELQPRVHRENLSQEKEGGVGEEGVKNRDTCMLTVLCQLH